MHLKSFFPNTFIAGILLLSFDALANDHQSESEPTKAEHRSLLINPFENEFHYLGSDPKAYLSSRIGQLSMSWAGFRALDPAFTFGASQLLGPQATGTLRFGTPFLAHLAWRLGCDSFYGMYMDVRQHNYDHFGELFTGTRSNHKLGPLDSFARGQTFQPHPSLSAHHNQAVNWLSLGAYALGQTLGMEVFGPAINRVIPLFLKESKLSAVGSKLLVDFAGNPRSPYFQTYAWSDVIVKFVSVGLGASLGWSAGDAAWEFVNWEGRVSGDPFTRYIPGYKRDPWIANDSGSFYGFVVGGTLGHNFGRVFGESLLRYRLLANYDLGLQLYQNSQQLAVTYPVENLGQMPDITGGMHNFKELREVPRYVPRQSAALTFPKNGGFFQRLNSYFGIRRVSAEHLVPLKEAELLSKKASYNFRILPPPYELSTSGKMFSTFTALGANLALGITLANLVPHMLNHIFDTFPRREDYIGYPSTFSLTKQELMARSIEEFSDSILETYRGLTGQSVLDSAFNDLDTWQSSLDYEQLVTLHAINEREIETSDASTLEPTETELTQQIRNDLNDLDRVLQNILIDQKAEIGALFKAFVDVYEEHSQLLSQRLYELSSLEDLVSFINSDYVYLFPEEMILDRESMANAIARRLTMDNLLALKNRKDYPNIQSDQELLEVLRLRLMRYHGFIYPKIMQAMVKRKMLMLSSGNGQDVYQVESALLSQRDIVIAMIGAIKGRIGSGKVSGETTRRFQEITRKYDELQTSLLSRDQEFYLSNPNLIQTWLQGLLAIKNQLAEIFKEVDPGTKVSL